MSFTEHSQTLTNTLQQQVLLPPALGKVLFSYTDFSPNAVSFQERFLVSQSFGNECHMITEHSAEFQVCCKQVLVRSPSVHMNYIFPVDVAFVLVNTVGR